MTSLVPPDLAKRIDCLARAAHAFHRFAHHPLCSDYASEVFHIGRRTRVCRGCVLAASGLTAGACAALLANASLTIGVAALLAAAILATPTVARRLRRRGKVWTRFVPAFAASFACATGMLAASALGWMLALGSIALIVNAVRAYRRRGPDRAPCSTCPERDSTRACRGFAPIVRRERAASRLSGRWIAGASPERAGTG